MADDYRLFGEVVNTKSSQQLQAELRRKESQLRDANLKANSLRDDEGKIPQNIQDEIDRLKNEISVIKNQLTSVSDKNGQAVEPNSTVGDSTYKQLKQYAKSLKTPEEIENFRQQLLSQLQAKNIPVTLNNGEYTVPKEYKNDPHYKILYEFTKSRFFTGTSKWGAVESKTNKQNAKAYDKMAGNPLMDQAAIDKTYGGNAEGASGLGQRAAKSIIAACLAIDTNNLSGYNQQIGILKQILQKVDSDVKSNDDAWIIYHYNLCSAIAQATPGKVLTAEFIQNAKHAAEEDAPKVQLSAKRIE